MEFSQENLSGVVRMIGNDGSITEGQFDKGQNHGLSRYIKDRVCFISFGQQGKLHGYSALLKY